MNDGYDLYCLLQTLTDPNRRQDHTEICLCAATIIKIVPTPPIDASKN